MVNEEAKGRGSMKVISNPFAGIAPIPINVPSDPLSGLMAMEAEELETQMDGRIGVEPVCGERLSVNDVTNVVILYESLLFSLANGDIRKGFW